MIKFSTNQDVTKQNSSRKASLKIYIILKGLLLNDGGKDWLIFLNLYLEGRNFLKGGDKKYS